MPEGILWFFLVVAVCSTVLGAVLGTVLLRSVLISLSAVLLAVLGPVLRSVLRRVFLIAGIILHVRHRDIPPEIKTHPLRFGQGIYQISAI